MPRDEEYEFLNTFIDDDSLFSWQVLSGAGGSGKSRLGLEYCKSLPFYWEKGFYSAETLKPFQSWTPSYNTFIVIDNVGTKIDFVKKLIELLSSNSKNFLFKVRILLLERELKLPNNWYGGEDNNLIDYQFKEPLPITELNKRNLAKIIRTFHDFTGSDKKLLKMLKDFDNDMRPLYAAIFGYLLERTNGTENDLRPLIIDISDRYWKDEKIDEKHYLLIALITIIERLNPLDLENDLFPSEEELNEHWLEITMGQGSGDSTIMGISPHIIGEAFVLEVLKTTTPLIEKIGSQRLKLERTKQFIEYCWQHYAAEMAWFFARCYRDFSAHELIEILCSDEDIARLNYEDNKSLLNFPAIYFILIYKFKSRARAEASLENFKQVILKKQNKYWSFAYITACVALFEKYVEDRDFLASKSLFRDVLNLEIEERPGYPMCNLSLAAVYYWVVQKDYESADKEFKASLLYLNDNLDLSQFRKFTRLFENIYIQNHSSKDFSDNIDFIINTYEEFEKIADKKENDSFLVPLYKVANNYFILLNQHGKEEKLSEIWDETIIKIMQSDSKELTDIGARIAMNGIGYFEMTDPFGFLNVGGKLLYFHYKNNSLETSMDLVYYLHEYAKHCPDSILVKEEINYYSNLQSIPMSPENSKKFTRLLQIEYNHLMSIYKNELENLPAEKVRRFDPDQLTKARESRKEDSEEL